MSVVKKQPIFLMISLFGLLFIKETFSNVWPTNTRNDPFPYHSAWDPHYFLYEREKQLMFGYADEKGTPECVMISLSPFGQNADVAKTISGTYCAPQGWEFITCPGQCNNLVCNNPPPPPNCPACINSVNIGDIDGRWNLLGLLAGKRPKNQVFPELLLQALNKIFPGVEPGDVTATMIQIVQNDPCRPLFGYLSVPLKYRKRGIRWDIETMICGDFGLQFLGGVVEISQVLNPCFINLTDQAGIDAGTPCAANVEPISRTDVDCFLYKELIPLARQLGMDVCNFTKWGIEDLYFSLFWRHAHVVNFNRDLSWARLLVIPFVRFGGGIATGDAKDQRKLFSLPFGNNGSHSININAGMNFDFVETVEIGAEAGYSHFFSRNFDNFRVPTNYLQSGIFPFATSVEVSPGDSAYVAGKLAAYHFVDRLSFWGQWAFVHHRKDKIRLLEPDDAFIDLDDNNPLSKCPNTAWRAQFGTFALTYDISPNFGIGALWQQMFHARNVYNVTTVMFTLNIIF